VHGVLRTITGIEDADRLSGGDGATCGTGGYSESTNSKRHTRYDDALHAFDGNRCRAGGTAGPIRPERGLIAGMDDYDRGTQANLPAVVVPRAVTRASWADQRLTRWHLGDLPDQLRRACRHPVVVGSLTVAAELIAHAGLRWALAARGQSAGLAESAIAPTPATVPDGESVVLYRRTIVVESWMVRSCRR
jgi:hypothetical protein